MADFSLTTVFVVPTTNSLPTSGSTENLTPGQFGIFKDDNTPATVGNVSGSKYVYFAQGSGINLYQGSKKSDLIVPSKLKSWYKAVGQSTVSLEIQTISNLVARCDEQVSVTFVIHSSYADTISFNGITKSVTVQMPCCNCDASPCDVIDNDTIVNLIYNKIMQDSSVNVNDPASLKLTSFLDFQIIGTSGSLALQITGKPLTKYGNPCDVAAFPFEYDRLWFRTFAYKGPDTTVDFLVYDKCEPVGTVTVVQRSSYPSGTSDEIQQLQKDYYSYQAYVKHLFRMQGYNQWFEDFVTPGTIYDTYYLTFDEPNLNGDSDVWGATIKTDERVILCIPNTLSASVEAILTAYFGAPVNKTGTNPTTTSTSSTSSTSSSSTSTTLIP